MCFKDNQWINVLYILDISMDIHVTFVDMDIDMDVKFRIHGKYGRFPVSDRLSSIILLNNGCGYSATISQTQ